MKVNLRAVKKPRIEMLPLIDMVFLLLVFFIYGMLSMAIHRGLPVLLPSSSTAPVEKNLTVSITVLEDGTIYLDKEEVTLEKLASFLRQKCGENKETGVLLFAHRDLPYQKLFRVLDQIRQAGLARISLQAEAEGRH